MVAPDGGCLPAAPELFCGIMAVRTHQGSSSSLFWLIGGNFAPSQGYETVMGKPRVNLRIFLRRHPEENRHFFFNQRSPVDRAFVPRWRWRRWRWRFFYVELLAGDLWAYYQPGIAIAPDGYTRRCGSIVTT